MIYLATVLVLGHALTEMVAIAHQFQVDLLGVNCCDFGAAKTAISFFKTVSKLPLMVYPNAGFPNEQGKYPIQSKMFCENLKPFISEERVKIVGGCCGTTPQYIQELIGSETPKIN